MTDMTAAPPDLQAWEKASAGLLRELEATLVQVLEKQGLAGSLLPALTRGASRQDLTEDPFDHHKTLHLFWNFPDSVHQGHVQLGDDGRVWAEFDILLPHPRKAGWAVEAVTAWGRAGALRGELKLLPEPGA